MVSANALKIEGLKKTIDFVCEEVKDIKGKVSTLEKKSVNEEKRVDACQQRISELERYSRRWNLRLYGVAEGEKEDPRKKIIEICQAILPENKDRMSDTIDTVHRLGPKRPNVNRPRGIIIQFTSRVSRDAIWRAAKSSPYLTNNGLKFAEDLSKEDRECRSKLWPAIKKAREDGKTAYFVGGRGFVNGSELSLPT